MYSFLWKTYISIHIFVLIWKRYFILFYAAPYTNVFIFFNASRWVKELKIVPTKSFLKNGDSNSLPPPRFLGREYKNVFLFYVISMVCNENEDEIQRTIWFTNFGVITYITTTNSESFKVLHSKLVSYQLFMLGHNDFSIYYCVYLVNFLYG